MNTLNLYSQTVDGPNPYYCFIDTSNKFIQCGAGWGSLREAIGHLNYDEEDYDMWIKDRYLRLPAEFLDQETPEQYKYTRIESK